MKRTKLFAILLAAAMLLTLCACGNTDAPAQDNTADTTEPAPAPVEPAPAPVEPAPAPLSRLPLPWSPLLPSPRWTPSCLSIS